jgi:hypothetical protein
MPNSSTPIDYFLFKDVTCMHYIGKMRKILLFERRTKAHAVPVALDKKEGRRLHLCFSKRWQLLLSFWSN